MVDKNLGRAQDTERLRGLFAAIGSLRAVYFKEQNHAQVGMAFRLSGFLLGNFHKLCGSRLVIMTSSRGCKFPPSGPLVFK